jgi:hypothetical protein
VNIDANHLVYPSRSIANTQMMIPASMYGRLLPNLEVQLSARTPGGTIQFEKYRDLSSKNAPIRGCTTKPETGPATNTMAIFDFESPRERRYGEARKCVAQELRSETDLRELTI